MTQLARSSEARKVELTNVSMRVTPRFDQVGSIKAGTVKSRLLDIETSLDIESPAPVDEVRELIAIAENMCFMMDVITEPHEMRTATVLNGEPLD